MGLLFQRPLSCVWDGNRPSTAVALRALVTVMVYQAGWPQCLPASCCVLCLFLFVSISASQPASAISDHRCGMTYHLGALDKPESASPRALIPQDPSS